MRGFQQSLVTAAVGTIIPLALFAAMARAELPPGAYEELLRDAQEVLDLRVTRVAQTDESDANMQHFNVSADVLGVVRSKAGIKQGDKISFHSYYVTDAARRRGFAGPQSPPRLQAGWTGRVYSNPAREGEGYDLAAYGRSFEPSGRQPGGNSPRGPSGPPQSPSDAPPRLGIQARSSQGGGLQILSVTGRSLADKLGLRSGDRLIEINGAPVDRIADVAAALTQNTERLDVKIQRDGETIELSLKR